MTKLYFRLFSNCIPVKGYAQSVIYDLQMSQFGYIPTILFEILQVAKEKSVEAVKTFFNNEYNEGIDTYFEYLIAKKLGFYTNEPELYPDLDLSWDSPFGITNVIIDNNLKLLNNRRLSIEVDDLTIILKEIDKDTIKDLENLSACIRYQSVQFFIEYNELIENYKSEIIKAITGIAQMVIYNAPDYKEDNQAVKIIYVKEAFDFSDHCNVHLNYFSCNIPHFTEAQYYNTYLNRKLYVSSTGDIKNSPRSKNSFGNINYINNASELNEIMKQHDFVQLSNIHKDKIEVCKDCEFRYMCVDNRIPIQKDGIWYHETECNYNPYITKWKGE